MPWVNIRNLCELITKKRGDYVIAIKENQPTLYNNVVFLIEETFEQATSTCTVDEKGHGRAESRTCLVMEKNEKDFYFKEWPNLQTIVCVDSVVI